MATAPNAPAPDETVLWRGTPSHVTAFWVYVLCVVLAPLIVPIFYALWVWLGVRNREYTLTSERLRLRTGILNKRTDLLELYRVRDSSVHEPLLYRLFGVGNIVMETSDRSHPTFVLQGIDDPHAVHEHLRRQVEAMRMAKRVREVDFE